MTAAIGDLAVRLYTVNEIADLWGVGTTYVYEEISAGRLATVQLGNGDRNKLRVRASAAQAWIDSRSRQ